MSMNMKTNSNTDIMLFESELKVMESLWEKGALTAGQLAAMMKDYTNWNRNTTYTVIKKLIAKGAVERSEPNFTCKALVSKEQIQQNKASEVIDKFFDGSAGVFLSTFVDGRNLSADEIKHLKEIVKKLDKEVTR